MALYNKKEDGLEEPPQSNSKRPDHVVRVSKFMYKTIMDFRTQYNTTFKKKASVPQAIDIMFMHLVKHQVKLND